MTFVVIILGIIVLTLFWFALVLPSYFDLKNEYRRGRCEGSPIFWKWILPIKGNSRWFYRMDHPEDE